MKKLLICLPVLLMSLMMFAEPKPLRVLVLGDDPTMLSDESKGAVGYAELLKPLFDEAVTLDVQASAALLPADPDALLETAQKGDVVLLCKQPVEEVGEDKLPADIYLKQLMAVHQAAKKKGVEIVWLTPVCPRYFTAEDVQVHRLGYYPEVIRRMCLRDELPLVDLEQLTFDWLTEGGKEASAEAFVAIEPASAAAAEKAAREGNLLTQAGADKVVELIANALRADKKGLLNKRLR